MHFWLLWFGWIWIYCLFLNPKILPEPSWKFLVQHTSQVLCHGCGVIWITDSAREKDYTKRSFAVYPSRMKFCPSLQTAVLVSQNWQCNTIWPSPLPFARLLSPESSYLCAETWERPCVTLAFTGHGEQLTQTKGLVESSGQGIQPACSTGNEIAGLSWKM